MAKLPRGIKSLIAALTQEGCSATAGSLETYWKHVPENQRPKRPPWAAHVGSGPASACPGCVCDVLEEAIELGRLMRR